MIDLSIINEEIGRLENADTNYSNCSRLADLYTVRHFLSPTPVNVVEHNDERRSAYDTYCDKKKKREYSEDEMIEAMQNVSIELKEMIHTLYDSLETPEERAILIQTIADIKTLY